MAQLPATRTTRDTLLQNPPAGPRSPERHSQPTRLQCPTPGRTGQVGTLPGPRPHHYLRKMRTTNHKPRHMGPRTHPGPHHMDRTRTRTLQPKRRTSQQHTNARTLDTTTLTNSASIRDDDMTKGQTERDQQAKQNADQQRRRQQARPRRQRNASQAQQRKPNTIRKTRRTGQTRNRETTRPNNPESNTNQTDPTPQGGAPSRGADRPPVRGLASAEGSNIAGDGPWETR